MSKPKAEQIQVFLQARMSSQRLPGKVLARIGVKPMYLHVFERVSQVVDPKRITVVTSSDPSDDSLCVDLVRRGISYFRGDLDDVLGRFQAAWKQTPGKWVMRISCDSPLISPGVIRLVLDAVDDEFDLVTNVFPRSFPKGQSVEVLNESLFSKLVEMPLNANHREHVTQYIYENPARFRILNVANPRGDQSGESDVVDTAEDLANMKRRMET